MDSKKVPDETKTLIEYMISDTTDEKGNKKKLIIKFCQLIYKSGRIVFNTTRLNRIELCQINNEDNPFSISLTMKAFRWLLDCIKFENNEIDLDESDKKFKFSIYPDSKIYTWIKLNEFYSQITVGFENSKTFGFTLSRDEKDVILKFGNRIKFLLIFNPNDTSNKCTTAVYVSVLADHIKNQIKNMCNGCKNDSIDDHSCKLYFRNRTDKYILLDNAENDSSTEMVYKNRLESIQNLLNIPPSERIEQEIVISNYKRNIDDIMASITEYIDLNKSDEYNFKDLCKLTDSIY